MTQSKHNLVDTIQSSPTIGSELQSLDCFQLNLASNIRPRIGLLGGSFNPVHVAHINLATTALRVAYLDEVQFILAPQPWQKPSLKVSVDDRLAMLKLAIHGIPQLKINLLELERMGPTYTIDTLQQLPRGADYFWIMGADQLQNFCSWLQWQEIISYVTLLVAQRPGYPLQVPADLQLELDKIGHSVIEIPFTESPLSSTQIRKNLAHGTNLLNDLHPAVLAYIKQHHLYQDND